MAKKSSGTAFISHPPKKRKGIHSKKRASKIKSSKNYLKRYRGQGR
jgi:hypothetical protein